MATTATNALLTINMITAKALQILHQKINFVGSINKQYDDSFAQTGAKIGSTLRIRLPNQYTVRNTMTLNPQNTNELNTTLTVANVSGVDISFSTTDLTLSIDDFSARYIEPAVAVIAADIESRSLGQITNVYNSVNGQGNAQTVRNFLAGRKILLDCANGATYEAAPEIFRRLGADVGVLAHEPDGVNINANCGSTHLERLIAAMQVGDDDAGFAFDGETGTEDGGTEAVW